MMACLDLAAGVRARYTSLYISLIIVVTFVFLLIVEASDIETVINKNTPGYGVILDAGSTSTKLKVYKYT